MDRAKFKQIVGNALGGIDDFAQARARDVYTSAAKTLGDRLGGYPRGALEFTRDLVHAPRSSYTDNPTGKVGFYGSRALQVGGLTAAGVGLVNLTHEFQNTFGGPADSQPMALGQYPY